MKLRTRIMLLFVGAIVVTASLTVVNYIGQSITFEGLESSLLSLLSFLEGYDNYDESTAIQPEYLITSIQHKLGGVTQEFYAIKSRVYIQTVLSVIAVMIIFALGMASLKKNVINRLDIVRGFIGDTYEHGPSHKRLQLSGKDELAHMGKLLNASLNVMESRHAQAEGRYLEDRKILLTLIGLSAGKVAYYRISGDLVGSNLTGELETKVTIAVREHITSLQKLGTETVVIEVPDTEAKIHASGVGVEPGATLLLQVKVEEPKDPTSN